MAAAQATPGLSPLSLAPLLGVMCRLWASSHPAAQLQVTWLSPGCVPLCAGTAASPRWPAGPFPSCPVSQDRILPSLTHLHVLRGEAREGFQRVIHLVPLLLLYVLVVVRGALVLQPQITDELLHFPERHMTSPWLGFQEGGLGGLAPPSCFSNSLSHRAFSILNEHLGDDPSVDDFLGRFPQGQGASLTALFVT